MNWFYVGCSVVCLPLILLFKERFLRSDVDATKEHVERNATIN